MTFGRTTVRDAVRPAIRKPFGLRRLGGGVPPLAMNGILAEGDSITYGQNAAGTAQLRENYPYKLANLAGFSAVDVGARGDTAANINTNYATQIGTYYNAASRDTLLLLIGVNDLNGGATDTTLQGDIQGIVTKAKTTGYKVVVGTILPSSWLSGTGKDTYRLAVNAWIKGTLSASIDRVIDFASIALMADPTNTTYYNDGTHPTKLGYALMADCARAALGLSVVGTQQWHVADYASAVAVYSNANKSLRLSGSSIARSFTAISGKRVYAVKLNPVNVGGYVAIGLSSCNDDMTASGGAPIAFDSGSVAYYDNGNLFYSTSQYVGMPTLASLDTVGVVVDTTANLAWFTKDGTNFYGATNTPLTRAQVEAGTSGFSIAGITNPLYAAVGTYSSGDGVFDLLQAWPWTTPAGYSYLA